MPPAPEQQLIGVLERTLGISMGVRLLPIAPKPRVVPTAWISLWLVGYGLLLVAVLAFGGRSPKGHEEIVTLLVWFALYFAVALYVCLSTTPKIFDTIRHDILPHVPDAYVDAVAADLASHFTRRQRIGVPLLVATVSTIAATWMLGRDIEAGFCIPGRLYSAEMLLWGASYFLCFYTAATGVVCGQFYLFFARNLALASSRFYVLAAAETPLVKALAKLGTQMLVFWGLIFLAIASCMLLTIVPPEDYRLPAKSWLLSTMIPISLFFSLGFGTLVYLASEAAIRSALQRFSARHAAALQGRMMELLSPAEAKLPSDTAELDRLREWHDRIMGGGRYGSRIGATVSIALPLLVPVLTLLGKAL